MSNDNENEKSTANGTIAEKENEIEQENDLYQMRTAKKNRVRRQSPGRQSLCQTNFQFITPKAALNSQGNDDDRRRTDNLMKLYLNVPTIMSFVYLAYRQLAIRCEYGGRQSAVGSC